MAEQASGYKLVFEFPRMMTDFATAYLDEPWMPGLDWSTLELVPGDFVTGDLRERTNDPSAASNAPGNGGSDGGG